jgi:hypothetical protein
MFTQKVIDKKVKAMCKEQTKFLFSYPRHDLIKYYDWQLDLEKNPDYAIWELEMFGE